MFNRVTSIILLAALIGTNCSRFFVIAGFELNQKYIADNLCVNKSRPWMHCNGHCYFMKKIRDAQEKEKKQEKADQKNLFQEALPATIAITSPRLRETGVGPVFPRGNSPQPIHRSYTILLPPKIA
eukprot:gene14797-14929_t